MSSSKNSGCGIAEKNYKGKSGGLLSGGKSTEKDTYRLECFEKQLKFMVPTITPVGVFCAVCMSFLWAVGVVNMATWVVFSCGVCALLVGVNPGVLCGKGPQRTRVREGVTMVCFFLMIACVHASFWCWKYPSKAICLFGYGETSLLMKVFLVGLHFSSFRIPFSGWDLRFGRRSSGRTGRL